MENQKIIEVSITLLKITSEDKWLDNYIKIKGDKIENSPQYFYLIGKMKPIFEWMDYRKLNQDYLTKRLIEILVSIVRDEQKKSIKIYKDYRINTGHKRASCMLYLGYEKIKAIIVPDNYKL